MFLTRALQWRGRRQASNATRWGGCSFLGRILLWTQNRQQLPTVWKQTVKQSRLLRLQHPIKCNLNQASHLFSIPFSLCFPSAFGQSLQLCWLTLTAPDTSQASTYRTVLSTRKLPPDGMTSPPKERKNSIQTPACRSCSATHPWAVFISEGSPCVPFFHPTPPAVARITLQGYSGQRE